MTKANYSGAFKGHRFPPEIIAYAVWTYFRFPLSLRDFEDLLAADPARPNSCICGLHRCPWLPLT